VVPSIHRESSLPEEGIHRLLFREQGQAAPHLSHNLIFRGPIPGNKREILVNKLYPLL
jgi:hypothetical protein